MSNRYVNMDDLFIAKVNSIFEAEGDENDAPNLDDAPEAPPSDPSNIEIAPPPESANTKNSDSFISGKVSNSYIDNDPAIHNLIEIMSADMEDQDKIRGYVEVLFTRTGLNDVDPEKFKLLSSELWNKLEELAEIDPRTSLAEFTNWAHEKIGQANR